MVEASEAKDLEADLDDDEEVVVEEDDELFADWGNTCGVRRVAMPEVNVDAAEELPEGN